jgi:hypothetical protein
MRDVETTERPHGRVGGQLARDTRRPARRALAWFGGGTNGNEQLTATAGVVLLILLPLLGITILRIGQLIWEHLFLGLLLIGPVLLKMASTGYRFVRYYSRDTAYRHKGPPELILRLIAPLVVLTTVEVFVTGVLLLFEGPSHRGTLLLLHKVGFFAWLAFMALHVLGHLPGLGTSLQVTRRDRESATGLSPGGTGRGLALVGALVGGVVLAVVLIPDFSIWTASGALAHHHHHLGG